jgi:hypothetical protein
VSIFQAILEGASGLLLELETIEDRGAILRKAKARNAERAMHRNKKSDLGKPLFLVAHDSRRIAA